MELFKNLVCKLIQAVLLLAAIFPLKKNKIVFFPYNGKYYCNLKYITNCLLREKLDFEIVWVSLDSEIDNTRIIKCRKNSVEFFYHVLSAKILIYNSGFVNYIPKRQGQIFIETWHGGGAYKKIAKVFAETKNKYLRNRIINSVNRNDYIISSCSAFEKAFKSDTLALNPKYCNFGMPRNDIFFDIRKINRVKDKIFNKYHLKDKKIVMYAPTFRDGGFINTIHFDSLLKALENRFSSEFVLFLRCHPHLSKDIFENYSNDNIIDVSDVTDMQELLCATDILITDYSSCMWDFSLTYKPCFIYANDIDCYKQERDFHTPITDWPFPVATNNEELIVNILNFENEEYIKRIKKHHKALGSYEDGHASKRVYKLIKKVCT